jgi:hypothetical protein
MESSRCGFSIDVPAELDVVRRRVVELLAEEGFGVLTEIDVRQTLKRKLDLDFRPYRILGACNARLAHRALEAEPGIGLLLPCNVVLEALPEGASRAARPDRRLAPAVRCPRGEELVGAACPLALGAWITSCRRSLCLRCQLVELGQPAVEQEAVGLRHRDGDELPVRVVEPRRAVAA